MPTKKLQQEQFQNTMGRLSRKWKPDDILYELSMLYEEFSIRSTSEAEVEFWLKCSKATKNLSGGMEKWLGEMEEEQEEE
jgi:hypothetical protein